MKKKSYVYNETRQSFLSLGVDIADTHLTSLKGLLGKRRLKNDEGLWVVPSQGIHTIGVLFPIDVIYLDADLRVIHLVEHLSPFRIGPLRTTCESVLQMPTKTIYSSRTQIGDKFAIGSADEVDNQAGEKFETSRGLNGLKGRWVAFWQAVDAWISAARARRANVSAVSSPAAEQPAGRAGVRNRSIQGQTLIEFALILPLLLVLIVNVVNFGTFFFAWITVANAARSGAQYMCMGGASVGSPKAATSAQIYNLVAADMSSLQNRTSLAVRVCAKKYSVPAVCSITGSGSFADPVADTRIEAPLYVMGWVDVSYAYVPPIPGFSIPSLGVYATLPPLTIHRQSVMRLIQ